MRSYVPNRNGHILISCFFLQYSYIFKGMEYGTGGRGGGIMEGGQEQEQAERREGNTQGEGRRGREGAGAGAGGGSRRVTACVIHISVKLGNSSIS